MGNYQEKIKSRGIPYFNFIKFEKLLDELCKQGVNVTDVDYPVKNLKKFQNFEHFFDNFSEQQIKSHLTFYAKQFDDFP